MTKSKILFLLLLLLISSFYFLKFKNNPTEEKIHYHAGFKVFINGQEQDFAKALYMESLPCTIKGAKKPPEDPQLEKAHLHDNVGDVVHVHRLGGVWGDLFKNIKFNFPENATVSGYISGNQVENILNRPINSYESVIFVVGDTKLANLNHYVTVEHIKEVEQKSESCGSN